MKRRRGVIAALLGICLLALPVATHNAQAGNNTDLTITKTTVDGNVAAPGGTIDYEITIQNPTAGGLPIICVLDDLPAGFTYHTGSGTVDGTAQEPDNTDCTGGTVGWFLDDQTIASGGTVTVDFTADVADTEPPGCYSNIGVVQWQAGETISTLGTGFTAVAEVTTGAPQGCATPEATSTATAAPTASATAAPAGTPPASVRTATPSSTATPMAASTAQPTAVVSSTPAPAATAPGGNVGGLITAPNTGTGGTGGGASATPFAIVIALVAGGALTLAGIGGAMRRRR